MEIIVLGCGFSLGCPVLGCKCRICTSEDKYNKRTRCAIIIRDKNTTILIDFGPDIKNQLLQHQIDNIDYVICTHAHNDHISGIDDLRALSYSRGKALPIFSDEKTLEEIKIRNSYLFDPSYSVNNIFDLIPVDKFANIKLADFNIQFFEQIHGANTSLGIRIGDFVYSNDVTEFPEKSRKYLNNIKHWILDCIDYERTHAHAGLNDILKWKDEFLPNKIYLTNLGHNIDYAKFSSELPKNISPCFDGFRIITM